MPDPTTTTTRFTFSIWWLLRLGSGMGEGEWLKKIGADILFMWWEGGSQSVLLFIRFSTILPGCSLTLVPVWRCPVAPLAKIVWGAAELASSFPQTLSGGEKAITSSNCSLFSRILLTPLSSSLLSCLLLRLGFVLSSFSCLVGRFGVEPGWRHCSFLPV